MKRIIVFAAFIIAATAFTACQNKTVDPYIIGTGVVKKNLKGYYVTVGMEKWQITSITALKVKDAPHSRAEEIVPVEGLVVTVFTSDNYPGVQAVLGEQNQEQIEALYHADYTHIILGCILGVLLSNLIFALIRVEYF